MKDEQVHSDTVRINLLDYSKQSLRDLCIELGEKPFRADQLLKWIHQQGVTSFDDMNNLNQAFRLKLKSKCEIVPPKIIIDKPSLDGTHKWLLQMSDGNCVEAVFIPEAQRGTLCISSQVGCILNCSFCSTGKQGFSRNLLVSEIIGQLWVAVHALKKQKSEYRITNVVMMGMGEPLLNFDPLVSALSLMMDDLAYGLSKRRVTVSTSGVVPKMYELLDAIDVSLVVSLHAPNDILRNELVPLNKKYPLKVLLEACREYAKRGPQKEMTFEYTMMDQVNDTLAQADELSELLKTVPAKINLIPFNPFPNSGYRRPSNNRIHAFQQRLQKAGYIVTIRKTRGDDIDAACGQLVGAVKDKTKRSMRYKNA